MELGKAKDRAVRFSARNIQLINYYDVEGHDVHRGPKAFQQRSTYYVQNKSNSCKKVRVALSESSDPAYQLLRGTEEHYLAAGLKLPIVLQYSPDDSNIHLGEIIVYIDDEPTVVVPIKAILPVPQLEVCPSVIDFGDLVCEHQITCQSLTLTNTGSKKGNFMFLVDQLPSCFKVLPTQWTLLPGEAVDVKVEVLCKKEGSFSEHLRIASDDMVTLFLVKLCGVITTRQLKLLDPSDSSCSLERVVFGDVYYGTTVSRKVLLYNDSPVSTQYLAVLNADAEGAVDGMDANKELAMVWSKTQDFYKDQGHVQSGETMLQVVPMQGSLDPYEKKMLKMIFAPQFEKSNLGWTHHQSMPIHKDYALFVQFLHIGDRKVNVNQGSTLEIAVTGTARPLQLTIKPRTFLNFGPCTMGQILTKKLLLYNASNVLPINFQCRQVAHYKCLPTSGKIIPGQEIAMMVTFQPKQVGPLNYKMYIDMMCPGKGKVKEAFHSIVLDLHGTGEHLFEMSRKRKLPAYQVTGASPNDRNLALVTQQASACYAYDDPDYCYNSEEVRVLAAHRQGYIDYNRERQAQKQWKKREKALFNPAYATKLDLNMPPAYGLSSRTLSILKGQSSLLSTLTSQPPTKLCSGSRMLMFKDIDNLTSGPLEFIEYCPSKSMNFEVSSQCESQLSPVELSQILFEPAVLDFGSAIVDSTVKKTIAIKNFSQKYISVMMEENVSMDTEMTFHFNIQLAKAEIHCKKYSSNPRFILAPRSYTEVTLFMQLGNSGIVERCVWYSINDHHNGHLPVKTNVTQLTLSLSTTQLNLTEPSFASKTAGLMGSVCITNQYSVAASYQWHAMEGVDPDIFSATHPSGVIPAGCSLECEFVCLPSFDCPTAAQFLLAVGDGHSTPTTGVENCVLTLVPKFNKPSCEFREKRLLLGTVPLNLTTVRTVHIENKGNCHAYFKIRDPTPYSGMKVYCESGCVPVGGNVELQVLIKPEITELFDVKLLIDLKGGKSISLRITGTVEYPFVSISKDVFQFGGVYCGATAAIPFTVSNKGLVRVQLVFELSYLSEFALTTSLRDDSYGEISIHSSDQVKGVFVVDLPGKSDAQCELQFCPQTVASYDYQLPLLVNGLKTSSTPSSSWPPSNTCSSVTLHQNMPMEGKIPTCRVLATVLRSPLLVSNTILNFSLHPGFLDKTPAPIEHKQVIKLSNAGEHPLSWVLDCSSSPRVADKTFQFCLPSGISATNKFLLPTTTATTAHLQPGEEFVFTALCCPSHHGTFECKIPLILNGDVSRPYRSIELRATFPAGRISINPSHIVVQPVPLRMSVIAKFTVYVEYFTSPVVLEVSLPTVEKHVNLVVTFPEGSAVYNCYKKTEISCQLEFSSKKPISKSDYIIIADKTSEIRNRIPFTVVADNSLFTLYTSLAKHINSTSKSLTQEDGNLIFQQRAQKSGFNLPYNSTPYDGDTPHKRIASTDIMCIQGSVSAICRWLSAYGWSNEIKSILSPLDLRIRMGADLPKVGVKQRSDIGRSRGLLLDLLTNLCGRIPPGIPLNLPPCTTTSEKVNQQYSTYDSIISFLRNQGGLLWYVAPETLLDYQDYQQWIQDIAMNRNINFDPQNEEEFNDLSQQAWTHLLMQIIKVLVLPHVIRHIPKYLEDKVCSTNDNIYSIPERVLLAWLNFHHDSQRKRLPKGKDFGIEQIINFDVDLMDSIVLACVLASYCPFLLETHFKHFYMHPSHPEQCSHNAITFVHALKYIGIDYDIQPSDICSPNAVSMILFVIHLYERMSSFKPKRTITFETILGEAVNQQVQLENPTTKQLEYHILIRGEDTQDFQLINDTTTIILAGRQSDQLCLTFHGHNLSPSSAVLLILARGNRMATSSVQAFRLWGYVSKAKPQFSSILTASLYELQIVSLTVTNPFHKSGFFKISLNESGDKEFLSSLAISDIETYMIPSSSLQKRSDDQMHMFELANQSTIFLESGYTASLVLKFVPLKLIPRHCAVTLKNKELGDIVLSVYATVTSPKPSVPESRYLNSSTVVNTQTRTLHLKAHAGQSIEEEIIFSRSNVAFENALLEVSKWSMSQKEIKQRLLSESFKYAILSTAITVLGNDNELQNHQLEKCEKIVFSIKGSDNKHFCFPREVCLLASSKDVATVPIKFHADCEGQYECCLVLKSMYDVRVVIIESTVLSTGKLTELEFKTKALLPLTQNIPLINPSTVDWPLVATLNGTNFEGPKSVIARCLATTSYPLTFIPHREGIVEGDLRLTNSTDKSEYVFHLKGVADRPIAQDHINLCVQAKTSMTHILHVRNYHDRTMVFQVESDLDFITGPGSIKIGGHDVVDYPLLIVPRRQGFFTGAVAFVAQAMSRPHSFSENLETLLENSSSFHIWFQVECKVNAAPPDRVVMVSCPVFSSSIFQLSVVNLHSHHLNLQVSLEGHGLSGPAHMEIQPNGEALYPLTFTPTLVGQTKGRVIFNCFEDGEFWYQLDLFANDPKSISMSPISCELGKTCSLAISLTNPLDIPVRFKCNNTNTKHFIVTGLVEGQITVDPNSSENVHILFKPSAIGAANHATKLIFISEQFGRYIFLLQGHGISPEEMDPINITANLGSSNVHVINFTNPLDIAMHFSVSLKGEDFEHFCLLMKQVHSILLHPGVSLDIPIMFAPEVMRGHKANVVIIADDEYSKHCWSYPVFGRPELRTCNNLLNITCNAKERLEHKFEVSLISTLGKCGTTAVKATTSGTEIQMNNTAERASVEMPYNYKLVCHGHHLVEKCTGIQLTDKRITNTDMDMADTTTLEFVLVFTPPRAFRCSCDLHITGREGAAWIFPLCMIATPAAPDDIISMEAVGLNKESRVCLRLTSLTEHPAPFTAQLASNSDSEISVFPTSGELTPMNSQGTPLYITYKPRLYGRKHHAKLIVQSETNEWCYDIVGMVPTLSSPWT